MPVSRLTSAAWPLLCLFGLLGLAAAASPLFNGQPASLAWSSVATLASAAIVLLAGTALASSNRHRQALFGLFVPLVIAGSLSAIVVVIQIFFKDLAGNDFVSASSFAERASGNLRQPNHLSSLALWALVGLVWLRECSALRKVVVAALAVSLVVTVVLTGSRTGLLGLLILMVWALLDKRLSSFSRRMLLVLPLVYALGWWLFKLWGARSLGGAVPADRIASGGDISSSRFAIWSNTLDLIKQHPWFGVGFGDFNFSWSLSPYPGRPTQFFDHTHNLLLHWMAELGVPLALLLIVLLVIALWRAFAAAQRCASDERSGLRSAFMLILLITVHSLLEYPLWYAYFLLPTAFAFGICLGSQPPDRTVCDGQSAIRSRSGRSDLVLRAAALLMMAATLFAVRDYYKVVIIFAPPAGAATMAERIEAGKRSLFFAHHAHYAAATTAEHPSQAFDSLRLASHFLLDTRLMLAWVKAYVERGEPNRASYLADRLREFDNPNSSSFFAVCDAKGATAEPAAVQCQPAKVDLSYRDFR